LLYSSARVTVYLNNGPLCIHILDEARMSIVGTILTQGPSVNLSTTYFRVTDLGMKPGLRVEKSELS
jgi:hypothetical protein